MSTNWFILQRTGSLTDGSKIEGVGAGIGVSGPNYLKLGGLHSNIFEVEISALKAVSAYTYELSLLGLLVSKPPIEKN